MHELLCGGIIKRERVPKGYFDINFIFRGKGKRNEHILYEKGDVLWNTELFVYCLY